MAAYSLFNMHYLIPPVIIFSNGKTIKQIKMTDEPEQRQISEYGYIIRESEEEGDQRERTSYIDYLYVTPLLCNSVLG